MLGRFRDIRGSPMVRAAFGWVVSLGAYGLLLAWSLGSSPVGASNAELASRASSKLSVIWRNPVDAPYKLLQDLLTHVNQASYFWLRLSSLLFGLLFLGAFYYLLRGWFGKNIAFLTTVLMAFTPFFMIAAKIGTPTIMFFAPAAVLAAYMAASKSEGGFGPAAVLAAAAGLTLYVPGMLWLIIVGLIYKRRQLRSLVAELELEKRQYAALLGVFVVLVAPLIAGLVSHPSVGRQLLLIPAHLPSLIEILKGWGWAIAAIFAHAPGHQEMIINRLPILDAAQIGLLIFGVYVMWSKLRSQFVWLAVFVLLITLLSGLSGSYGSLGLAVSLLSIATGMGLRYLFIEWRHVFPFNPIAKLFAIALMAALVSVHVMFGVRYSLMAWPVAVANDYVHVLE